MKKNLVMANTLNLIEHIRGELRSEFSQGKVPFHRVRDLVSSPRLLDVYVRNAPLDFLTKAGNSYLDEHTMLADSHQKTYAVSMEKWRQIESAIEIIFDFEPLDKSVINIQVWPYEPISLDDFQFRIAVALSFTRAELMYEYRTSGALDTLLAPYDFIVEEPFY